MSMGEDKIYKICRLCLSGKEMLMHIFDWKGIDGFAPAQVITQLLQCEVSLSDVYPQCVCSACVFQLRNFKQFRERCEASINLLDQAFARKTISPLEVCSKEDGTGIDSLGASLSDNCPVGVSISIKEENESDEVLKDIVKMETALEHHSISIPAQSNTTNTSPLSTKEVQVTQQALLDTEGRSEDNRIADDSDDEKLSCYSEWEEEKVDVSILNPNSRIPETNVELSVRHTQGEGSNENHFASDSDDENLSCYSEWEEEKMDDDLPESSLGRAEENTESSELECSTDPFGKGAAHSFSSGVQLLSDVNRQQQSKRTAHGTENVYRNSRTFKVRGKF